MTPEQPVAEGLNQGLQKQGLHTSSSRTLSFALSFSKMCPLPSGSRRMFFTGWKSASLDGNVLWKALEGRLVSQSLRSSVTLAGLA